MRYLTVKIKKHRRSIVALILTLLVTGASGQSWSFNNNSLNNWSTVRISSTTGSSHLTLTTTGQNNPKLKHLNPNINADSNIYAIVKMRVGSGGPTLLRINTPKGNKSTPITTGSSGFITYVLKMSNSSWNGTVNSVELAFKDDNGTSGGATHSSTNVTIEIEAVTFLDHIPSNQTVLY